MTNCQLLAPGFGGIPIRLRNVIMCTYEKQNSKLRNELVSTDYTSILDVWNESKIEVHFDWFCRTNLLTILRSSLNSGIELPNDLIGSLVG